MSEIPTMAGPRPVLTSASIFGLLKLATALTIAWARFTASADLKMPEPTNTPSMPSCIIRAASAGVATPPAAKLTTGRRPVAATCCRSSTGAWMFYIRKGNDERNME